MGYEVIHEAEGFWVVVVAESGEIISTHMSRDAAKAAMKRYEAADKRRSKGI